MLGWRMLAQGDYKLDIPFLSKEEEELILSAQERFKEATRSRHAKDDDEGRRLIGEILEKAANEGGIYIPRSQMEYLSETAYMHISGFGFLEPLIKDPEVEEISVIGPNRPVYVYLRKKGWRGVNACFEDEKSIGEMINRMSRSLGRHITMQNPRLDAMLPDGSRLHASLPPVSVGEITIRRFRDRPFSPRELCENGTVGLDGMAFLSILMQCDFSLLIAGNTASGKTTTMNALFSFVPENERVLIAEETPEINVPHSHKMRLVANRDMGISLKDLVYDSLRMRPDRMIVGEVRNKEEVEALFDVLLAGQARGSYATFHAQSAAEALSRLRSFGVREDDLKSVDCIVVQRRMLLYDAKKRTAREARKVVEVFDVDGGKPVAGCGGREAGCGVPGTGNRKQAAGCRVLDCPLIEKAAESFGLSSKEMMAELERRKKLISKAGPDFMDFFKSVQKELYGCGTLHDDGGSGAGGGGVGGSTAWAE